MTVLVTGATGVVGRALIDTLAKQGADVRAVSRQGSAAKLPHGEVVADTNDLSGVEAVFVHPRAAKDSVEDLVRRAVDTGVRRLVVMSAINADDAPDRQPSRFRGDRNTEVEVAVVAAETDDTQVVVLRCAEFDSNTFGTIGAQLAHGDVVRAAYPAATEAMIDERDIGEVAAHALLRDDLAGRRLTLTGPRALTLPERVEAVAAATGRSLVFEEVGPAQASAGLLAAGLPPEFVAVYLDLQAERAGTRATVSPDVAGVLGRPARTFADWARDHVARFAMTEVHR